MFSSVFRIGHVSRGATGAPNGKARDCVPGYPNLTELKGGKDPMILILVVSIFTIAIVKVTVEIRFGKNR
jgi:hypothetical protein